MLEKKDYLEIRNFYTAEQIARYANLSLSTIWRYERGERGLTAATLYKIETVVRMLQKVLEVRKDLILKGEL